MKLTKRQLRGLIREAYSNSKRRAVTSRIDQKFYELMTLLSKWQLDDDFLQNTTDVDVQGDIKELHRKIAVLSNQFDEIKQRTMF